MLVKSFSKDFCLNEVKLKQKIRSKISQEAFFPSWIGIFLYRFYFARTSLVDGIKRKTVFLSGRLIDIGYGTKPYQDLFEVTEYIGLDMEHSFHSQIKLLILRFVTKSWNTCLIQMNF